MNQNGVAFRMVGVLHEAETVMLKSLPAGNLNQKDEIMYECKLYGVRIML